jgi:hypothetical protein
MGKQTTNYGLTVGLPEDAATAIANHVPGPQSTAEKLGAVASGLLCDLALGGAMLPPAYAERIQQALGSTDPATITAAIEKAASKDGEATLVYWRVDPTQIAFYKQLADNVPPSGISLEQQLKSLLDYAFAQGWFGMGAPDVYKILLTAEQWKFLQQLFAKDIPTGEDVIDKLLESGPAQSEETDPFLEALK